MDVLDTPSQRYLRLIDIMQERGIDAVFAAQVLAESRMLTLQMKRMLIQEHPFATVH